MSTTAGPSAEIEHFVSSAPFDPYSIDALTPEQEKLYLASQWRMMWWRLKHHRLAVVSGLVLALMYGSILVTEFIAPYNLRTRNSGRLYAPPLTVRFFHDGELIGPFVYGYLYSLNMVNLKREYTQGSSSIQPL
jgi:peptide/nickel transport system permease protein